MKRIAENLNAVRELIAGAARRSGRSPDQVRLVAVSKTHPAELIAEAYEAGQKIFGENYAQEFREKADMLPDDIEWHFVGSLQRNKVKMVVDRVTLIHSLNKLSLAQEIDKRAGAPVKALIEINIAEEGAKSGTSADRVEELIEAARDLKNIELRGLMTMPPFFDDPDKARPYFIKLRKLRDNLKARTGFALDELSMGMSGDFEAAIEEGASIVRVGTAIFGERKRNNE